MVIRRAGTGAECGSAGDTAQPPLSVGRSRRTNGEREGLMTTPRDEELGRVIMALKRLLRNNGLHYAEVATAMAVSERSVQRWLNGEGMTLDLLARLCELIGVSMSELFALADHAVDNRPRQLTLDQEKALVEMPLRAFLFSRLLQGWSAEALQVACNLSEVVLVRHLLKFERLKLIELHPGNRIRLLTRRDIDWRKGGPMRRFFDQFAKSLVAAMEFGEPRTIWTSEVMHLTPTSAAAVEAKMQALRLEIRHLAETEHDVPTSEKLWYSLVLLAYRHDITQATDPLGRAFRSDER